MEAQARAVALGADQDLAGKRDLDSERLWLKILEAVEELLAKEPPEGTVVQ